MEWCKKIGYDTKREAKAAIKALNVYHGHELTSTYYCDECCAFHVTSMEKKKQRSMTRFFKNKKDANNRKRP